MIELSLRRCDSLSDTRQPPLWLSTGLTSRYSEKLYVENIDPTEVAIIIIDVWDANWCKYYDKLNEDLAIRLGSFVEKARSKGMTIVHSPCGSKNKDIQESQSCMPYYANHPARKKVLELQNYYLENNINTPFFKHHTHPNDFLFNASCTQRYIRRNNKYCTCPDPCERPWPRPQEKQHEAIRISSDDIISDHGVEIGYVLENRGIKKLLYVGGALNACLLDRPHGLCGEFSKDITRAFIRDLSITHVPGVSCFDISGNSDNPERRPPNRPKEQRERFKLLHDRFCLEWPGEVWFESEDLQYRSMHEMQCRYVEQKVAPSILSWDIMND